jgi:hypothetical protein
MNFLLSALFGYYVPMCAAALFLMRGSEQEQDERAYRWRPIIALAYWLVNIPILFIVWLYMNSSRWSVSAALAPAGLGLLLLSGLLAGAYLGAARLRWPLGVYASLLGVLSTLSVLPNDEGYIIYEQYPYTVKKVYRDYLEQPGFFDTTPTEYSVKELHMAHWGFDCYMGDIELRYLPPYISHSLYIKAQVEDSIWQRVRFLHLSPDSVQRLTFSPLKSASRYNAFTNRMELPEQQEQEVEVLINSWPERLKSPEPRY